MHCYLTNIIGRMDVISPWSKQDKSQPRSDSKNSTPTLKPLPSGFQREKSTTLKRVGARLGLRRQPELPYTSSVSKRSRGTDKLSLDRQMSSPARACFSFKPIGQAYSRAEQGECSTSSTSTDVHPTVISFDSIDLTLRESSYGSRLCLQPRLSRHHHGATEALLFSERIEDGFTRVRIIPLVVYSGDQTRTCDPLATAVATGSSHDISGPDVSTMDHSPNRLSTSLNSLLADIDVELDTAEEAKLTDTGQTQFSETLDFDVLYSYAAEEDACDDEQQPVDADGGRSPLLRRFSDSSVPSASCLVDATIELRQLKELISPREFVYETFSSGQLLKSMPE